MWLLLKYTLLYAAVLTLVALGGMFSERSGVINIALEGIMVVGGLMGVVAINIMNALGVPVFLGILITILAAGLAGLVYSSLLAFSAINLKADQTIGGTALNLLATALAMVIAKRSTAPTPRRSSIPPIPTPCSTAPIFPSTSAR